MKFLISIFILLFLYGCGSDDVYVGNNNKLYLIGDDSLQINYAAEVIVGYKRKHASGSDSWYEQEIWGTEKRWSGGWYYETTCAENSSMNGVNAKIGDKLLSFEFDKSDVGFTQLIFTSDGIFDNRGNKWEKK